MSNFCITGMRDGSAHVLRCLKVWYDLPSDVFHTALANIDTFLAKMKVNILDLITFIDCLNASFLSYIAI